ncbi:GTPase domain-containing protein [Litorihabitans aurantiacus]|uniref:ABC transporter n=1 Tax=Litorihabitans aurantiacus TaxID=1930061 RepID=A0AA37XEN7_9MICO|nr:GTPase domain-containing protein [Litorihabitans aurantiacus]GMA31918.1 ABC transporter [Litorihabitans aurantiacus]
MTTPAGAEGGATTARADLVSGLDVVRGRLAATTLPLAGAGVELARARRRALLDQLDDYLLPRLRTVGAPLLVVVGGSTGAGKSTLVNSLLGASLTRPGVLRPTTRSPVLVHHPADAPWFAGDRILPTLRREDGAAVSDTARTAADRQETTTVRALRLSPFPGIPAGLALLDAPDIDSLETANRDLAAQLLAAADLWLFVTTAARYADAVPWDLLGRAAERRAQIALVLDRVEEGDEEVVVDLSRLMAAHGLAGAPLFVVAEAPQDENGLLPAAAVADVAAWLSDLGGDARARGEIALATRDGVVAAVVAGVRETADAAEAQAAAAARLVRAVEVSEAEARAALTEATSDGAMLRGEVLARWQDLVGTSDVMRSVERGVSRVRDAVGALVRGRRVAPETVEVAIAQGLAAVTLDAVETARERTRALWLAEPAGAELVRGDGTTAALGTATTELRASIAAQIRGWQDDVLALVREQGQDRRGLARALSFGVNGLGVAVMVVVFAGTGGLSGAEIGIAGGTAVLAQKVLEAAFGDDAVRRLSREAATLLDERLGRVVAAESALALTRVAALGVAPQDGAALRAAADAVERAAASERADRQVPGEDTDPHQVSAAPPRLRGAELAGRVTGSGEQVHLSPYLRAAGADGAGQAGAGEPAGATGAEGDGGERRSFWRRVLRRGGTS